MMTRLKYLLKALGDQAQECENAIYQLGLNLNIDKAEGVVLDLFGTDTQQPRPDGYSDSDFRNLIKSIWAICRSSGTVPEIIQTAKICTGATIIRVIEPEWYARAIDGTFQTGMSIYGPLVYVFVNGNDNEQIRQLLSSKAAGVPIEIVLEDYAPILSGPVSDLPESFSPTDEALDNGEALSELLDPVAETMFFSGGHIAELITG